MNDADMGALAPILTVMADYGNVPFLWLASNPHQGGMGGNWVDGTGWDESYPMSEGLWRQFADWAIEFDQTGFYADPLYDKDWDWRAFNARGLQLSGRLKEEVGEAYRVVYVKPQEDANHRIDERTEILADGSQVAFDRVPENLHEPRRFCDRIVSGGQTGVDRAGLDFAILNDYTHGGWAPRGREAEDGSIPLIYQLNELVDGGYRQRNRRNVADSDGTLIVNMGDLTGGTLTTQRFAQRLNKPYLLVQLESGVTEEAVKNVFTWLRDQTIKTLNVAGPRASKRPGIYHLTFDLLSKVDELNRA